MLLKKPTYDELFDLVRSQSQTIKRLERKVAELEEKLKLNSKNSSKPPSTDQKGGDDIPKKKNGAKPGHAGYFRPLFSVDQVDTFIELKTTNCPTCGTVVRPLDKPPAVHQQVEIAPKPHLVTQYNRGQFYCPCCRKYGVASLPKEIGASAFGTRLSAFMGFLTGRCRLSRRIALNVLKEGLGLNLCVGSQSNVEERVTAALAAPYKEIEEQVRNNSETKHIDETGWKCWGKREFVWILSTASAALYKIQEGRGAKCRDALLGGASKQRVAFVTDRLATYRFSGLHQYCLAHIKRDITRFAERSGVDGAWGQTMLEHLRRIFELWRDYRESRKNRRFFRYASRRYRDQFEYGLLLAAHKERYSPSLRKFARCLLRRFKNLWVFVSYDGVEPTNNLAERDLRGIVIGRKISHGSKSSRGSRFIERINTVVATLTRQGKESLAYLTAAFRSWKIGAPIPTVCNRLQTTT